MNSYLTDDEIAALQLTALPRDTPFLIRNVSHGVFSISRHFGGTIFNGAHYAYIPASDELVREDVLKWATKRRKSKKGRKP